ncbi:phycobilisome degradation protein NblB [Calothrix sp. NIES-3974]|uniref:phycobilisome degradation protein NblB n=1 Tax=Calothrix sp. NIES-3974 TaxID=2005462 RepID=UPI000B5E5435|nr:HEAT repeat domain-containing protein [Calothrix sp. NIES-3974]BAZ05383.1 HEAT repeat-containing PBS lyase [Calothrix sp. NIES-3974]
MSITPESVQELLASEDLGDRLRAVNQIRTLEPAAGFELLQTAIQDHHARVRYAAISQMDTLGGQNPQLSLEILRDRLLNDKEPDVQAAAADCLGALKLTAAFEDLYQLYHSTSEWLIQFSIIAALGEMGDPRAFELLQQALNSDNELVQTTAIRALGELGNPAAIPLLVPYANNSDWQVRYSVACALNLLNQQGDDAAKSTLATLAEDEIAAVAEEAQRGLNV